MSDVHEAIMGSKKDGLERPSHQVTAVTKAVGNILEKHGVDDYSELDIVELAGINGNTDERNTAG